MAYSEITRAKALTGTTLDDTIIEALRDDADDDITTMLTQAYTTVPFDVNDANAIPAEIKGASIAWTCRNIINRMLQDESAATISRTGNIYETRPYDKIAASYDLKGRSLIFGYMMRQDGFHMVSLT